MKRMLGPALLALALSLPRSGWAGWYDTRTKIVPHLVPAAGAELCALQPVPACNRDQRNLKVRGDLGREYDLYLLALDADVDVGLGGVRFGIRYDGVPGRGIEVRNWRLCADDAMAGPDWGDSGSGIEVRWDLAANCQNSMTKGDLDSTVTAVIGVFRVLATSEDVFEVVPADSMGTPHFLAYTCAGERIYLEYPLAAGRAYFGPRGDGGYDPCRGPFSSPPVLSPLPADRLSGFAVRLSDLRPHGMSGAGTDITLQGEDALPDPLASFRRVGEGYPNHPLSDWGLPVPPEEMAEILRVLAGTSEQRLPPADPCLSIRIMATREETPRVSELLFDRDQATDVIEQLREVVYEDEAQRFFLDRFACVGDFIPARGPLDVTDSVMVDFGPYRSEPGSRVWSTITITNLSVSSLPAPLSLVLSSPYGQKIAEPPPNGMACRDEGPPRAFYDLDIGDALAPGDSVEFRFALEMTYNRKVSLAAKLLSGSGMR